MTSLAKACVQGNLARLQFFRIILRFATDVANAVLQLLRASPRLGLRCLRSRPLSRAGPLFIQGFPLV